MPAVADGFVRLISPIRRAASAPNMYSARFPDIEESNAVPFPPSAARNSPSRKKVRPDSQGSHSTTDKSPRSKADAAAPRIVAPIRIPTAEMEDSSSERKNGRPDQSLPPTRHRIRRPTFRWSRPCRSDRIAARRIRPQPDSRPTGASPGERDAPLDRLEAKAGHHPWPTLSTASSTGQREASPASPNQRLRSRAPSADSGVFNCPPERGPDPPRMASTTPAQTA